MAYHVVLIRKGYISVASSNTLLTVIGERSLADWKRQAKNSIFLSWAFKFQESDVNAVVQKRDA